MYTGSSPSKPNTWISSSCCYEISWNVWHIVKKTWSQPLTCLPVIRNEHHLPQQLGKHHKNRRWKPETRKNVKRKRVVVLFRRFFALWDPVLVRHSGENRQAQWPQAPRLVVFCATNGQIDNVPPRQRVRRVRTSTWDQNLQDFCAPKKRVPEQIVRILLARQLSMCFVKVWSRAETSSKCDQQTIQTITSASPGCLWGCGKGLQACQKKTRSNSKSRGSSVAVRCLRKDGWSMKT